MIFYTYDEKTKEYTGTQNAFIDPLETKKQGKNVYLVPANATDKKPLKAKENQAVIFNGTEWKIIADYRGKTYYIGTEQHEMKELGDLPKGATFEPVEPKKTLDELKAEKLEALTAYAGQFDQYKCDDMYVTSSIGGYKFNADIRSQTNMQGLIDVLADDATTLYKDYDNEFRTMTKADIAVLKSECLQNGQYLYQQKWTLQTKINACTSQEELDAIEIKFEMLEFNHAD